MHLFSGRFVATIAITAATLLAASGQALAQPGGRGFGGMGGGRDGGMLPAINSRQVDNYSKMLGLSKEQKESAQALLEGYAQQAAVVQKAMRDAGEKVRDEFRESGDPAVWGTMRDSMTKFRDERKTLDDGFLSDFKSVLTPQQAEKWPSIERAVRRDATLRWGRISGERVDLIDLTTKQKFPDTIQTQVAPILGVYEEELDRELARRNEVYEGAMQKMMELFRSGDMAAAEEIVEKGREAGIRVRDVNRKFARQIEDVLPEEQKAVFAQEVRKESFPDAYRKPYSTRAIDAANGFKDLSPEQTEKITQLNTTFTKEMDALSAKIAAATEEEEANFKIADMMQRGGGGRQEGPGADARRERRDLDRKTLESLKKILTEEQAGKLPERDEDEGGNRQRGEQRQRRNQT